MTYRSHPLQRFPHYAGARLLLLAGLGLGLALLTLQLFRLTVLQNKELTSRAADNLYDENRLPSPRGNILDRRGVVLATNRRTWSISFNPRGLRPEVAEDCLRKLAHMGILDPVSRVEEILADKKRVTIRRRASQMETLPLLERPADFPGVRLGDDFEREYPAGQTFAHLIGNLGKIPPEDVERYPRPRYQPDDEVGRAGLERHLEDELAGRPGLERVQRDVRGRLLADPEIVEQAVPGADVELTLDATLQQAAFDLLRGERGSIVLMEARTGALLVLASRPAFDPVRPGDPPSPGEQPGYLYSAVRGTYPPGSTFKVAGAWAALQAGIDPEETTPCTGSFRLPGWGRAWPCNVRTGHGGTNLYKSLQASCNVYYYALSERLGEAPLRRAAEALGFGVATGVDLPGEADGLLPSEAVLQGGELVNFSIGQGRLLATPLQVARAYAAFANGGGMPTPQAIASVGGVRRPPAALRATGLSPRHAALITEGLRRVVEANAGTAHKAGFDPAWEVVGKTGTAENAQGGVDAWFAGFYPRTAPRYVVVVHVEEAAGHGGEVAAPLARRMVEEQRRAEAPGKDSGAAAP